LLDIIGVHVDPEQRFHISLRPRFFALILAGFLLMIGLAAGMSVYSTRPGFCKSCHIMDPYYEAWKTSSHNHVACVECHYPPGETKTVLWKKFQALSQVAKYVTRTYSPKPFAEIEDASCLRSGCHSDRLLQGRVVSQGGVLFDHQPHLKEVRLGKQLRCVSCHSQIVVGTHMEVTWDTCYLCHFKGHKTGGRGESEPVGGCRGCHLLPDKEIQVGENVSVMHKDLVSYGGPVQCQACHRESGIGKGEVTKDRCFICHNEPHKVDRFHETEFIHENHVTEHNTACFHCHQPISHGKTITREEPVLDFSCNKCHLDMHDLEGELYSGSGLKGVPEMQSPMFQARVDCVGCHIEKEKTGNGVSHAMTFTGSPLGCANCHDDKYLDMVFDGQKAVDETVAALSENLDVVRDALKKPGLSQKVAAKIGEKVDEAAFNIELLKITHSAHNIFYAASALRYSNLILSAAAKPLEVQVQDTSGLSIISGKYCAQLCHESLDVNVPPRRVTFDQDRKLDHEVHTEEGLACNVCHDFGAHKNPGFKGIQTCLKCHAQEDLDRMTWSAD